MTTYAERPELYVKKGNRIKVDTSTYTYDLCNGRSDGETFYAIIMEQPRYKGRFAGSYELSMYDDSIEVLVKREDNGRVQTVCVNQVYPCRNIHELTEDELKAIRKNISFGSCFVSSYSNAFGVDDKELCDYAEGYLYYIEEEKLEDTPQEFADYVMCMAV